VRSAVLPCEMLLWIAVSCRQVAADLERMALGAEHLRFDPAEQAHHCWPVVLAGWFVEQAAPYGPGQAIRWPLAACVSGPFLSASVTFP